MFSAILKSTSKWLTKSIKPQVDPYKKMINVSSAFDTQYRKFYNATNELIHSEYIADITIKNVDFLSYAKIPQVDLIVTSPPYVTSYEYADLHQLSSLWLGYTDDFRELRKGTIGSIYNVPCAKVGSVLNNTGKVIVENMRQYGCKTRQLRSVERYYLDMQKAVHKCASMLKDNGMAFFVIGDTEYKGVKIKNSSHLVQCLMDEHFTDIKAARRRISNKLLTPYRDKIGRFSSDQSQRSVYHEEFIISARMR